MSQSASLKAASIAYKTPSFPAADGLGGNVFDYRDGTYNMLHEITFFKRDDDGKEARVEGLGRGMVTGDFLLVSGTLVGDPKTQEVAYVFVEVAQKDDDPCAFTGKVKEHPCAFDY